MGWSNFIKAVGKGTVRLTEGAGRSVGTVAKGVGEGMGATAKGLGGWKGVVGTGAVIGAVRSEDGLTGVASDVLFGQFVVHVNTLLSKKYLIQYIISGDRYQ